MRALTPAVLVLLWAVPAAAQIDVQRYDITLEVDDIAGVISGTTTVTLLADGSDTLALDLVGFEVTAVTVEGEPAAFSREGDQLRVTLEPAPPAGETLSVAVSYAGAPEPYVEEWGTYGVVWQDAKVYTVNVTHGARHWFPAHDTIADKAEVGFDLTVPGGWTAAAIGALVESETTVHGTERFVWEADWPVPTYLVHFGAAPWDITEATVAGVPVRYFLDAETAAEDSTWETLSHVEPVMAMLTERYGDYPYPKIAFDEITLAGAVEQPSLISLGTAILNGIQTFESVIAHELAHSWFINVVTIASWDDLWLSEGLCTYHEALYAEHTGGAEGLRAYAALLSSNFRFSVLLDGEMPVYGADKLFSGTVYAKGAMVFHMLRWRVGDQVFDDILRLYLERHAWGHASTEDFKAIAEELSGQDLGPFFEQWVYQPGYPKYAFGYRFDEDGAGGARLTVRVRQTQDAAQPTYTNTLEIDVSGPDDADTLLLEVDGREVVAAFDLDYVPEAVLLDPREWVLCEKTTEDLPDEVVAPDPDPVAEPEAEAEAEAEAGPEPGAELEPESAPQPAPDPGATPGGGDEGGCGGGPSPSHALWWLALACALTTRRRTA